MIGQYKRDFKLVPYNEEWVDHFNREADLLKSILGIKALQIVHVGSTSIPGMSAKAIIDIMIAVSSLKRSSELTPAPPDTSTARFALLSVRVSSSISSIIQHYFGELTNSVKMKIKEIVE